MPITGTLVDETYKVNWHALPDDRRTTNGTCSVTVELQKIGAEP